jgi:hypothetical protein
MQIKAGIFDFILGHCLLFPRHNREVALSHRNGRKLLEFYEENNEFYYTSCSYSRAQLVLMVIYELTAQFYYISCNCKRTPPNSISPAATKASPTPPCTSSSFWFYLRCTPCIPSLCSRRPLSYRLMVSTLFSGSF